MDEELTNEFNTSKVVTENKEKSKYSSHSNFNLLLFI
jgi:hypothetical protein